MSDVQFEARTPLVEQSIAIPRAERSAGVKVRQRKGLSLALITTRNGMRDRCVSALKASYGLDAPATAKIVQGRELSLAWHGRDGWLAVASDRPALETELKTVMGNSASIVDLSDARLVLRIGGPMSRALLAKGVSIDLHPRTFKAGDAAMTLLSHVAILLWQIDESPTFDLAIPRATAQDVFHWLSASATEFGLDVDP